MATISSCVTIPVGLILMSNIISRTNLSASPAAMLDAIAPMAHHLNPDLGWD